MPDEENQTIQEEEEDLAVKRLLGIREHSDSSRYSTHSESPSGGNGSKFKRNGNAGIAERRSRKYREIIQSGRHENTSPIMHSSVKRKLNEKTEGLLSIIQNCESLRDSYRTSQDEWRRSIDREQEGLEDAHKVLEKQTFRKKMLILKPEHHVMIRKVLPELYSKK